MATSKTKSVTKKAGRDPAAAAPPADPPKKPPAPPAAVPPPPPPPPEPDRSAGDSHRNREAERRRTNSASVREAGPLPPVADPARKEACRRDMRRFFGTYFKKRFPLPWCGSHLVAIRKMEECILSGGQLAYAMPRGSGKTALAEAGAVFALLYGHRSFVVLVGAEQEAGKEMLASIKVEFETNELLGADFPEVCHLIRELDGINNRAAGQTLNGVRTRIVWTDVRAVLPTVPGAASSGGRLRVAGITGRIRGMKATQATGESIRPDLCIVDDPQTDESATSPAGNNKREKILNSAVLGLAGPTTAIACFVPCTIIAPGDMAERILDRQRSPVWQGERSQMVLSWPKRRDLWDKYTELRKTSQRQGGKGEEATAFYLANRAAMDEGFEVSWPERFRKQLGEVSAQQHAMNLLCDRGQHAFDAEYQSDPKPEYAAGQVEDLDPDLVANKVNGAKWREVPPDTAKLTAFIDVGEGVLYYAVTAWAAGFRSGAVVDYGTYPQQNRSYFDSRDARPSLATLFPKFDVTARIYAGMTRIIGHLFGRPYPRHGGGEERLALCLIDSGHLPDTVYDFCREFPVINPLLLPSRGHGVTASRRPMRLWPPRPGEDKGHYVIKSPTTSGGRGTHLTVDVNYWKSFVTERWLTPRGGAGCLQVFGERPGAHQLFADHQASETRVRKKGEWGEVDEWVKKPGDPDNHWFDCVVGATAGAAYLGLQWSAAVSLGAPTAPAAGPAKVKWSEVQRQKREERDRRRTG